MTRFAQQTCFISLDWFKSCCVVTHMSDLMHLEYHSLRVIGPCDSSYESLGSELLA